MRLFRRWLIAAAAGGLAFAIVQYRQHHHMREREVLVRSEPASGGPTLAQANGASSPTPGHEVAPSGSGALLRVAGFVRYRNTAAVPATGNLTLGTPSGPTFRVTTAIEQGSFEALVPHAGDYEVTDVEVDGVDLPDTLSMTIAPSGTAELLLDEPVNMSILVLSAESREPLAAVAYESRFAERLVTKEGPADMRAAYAMAEADTTGRLSLPRAARGTVWYVGAVGYVGTVVRARSTSAPEVILLPVESVLRVSVAGASDSFRPQVHVETADGRWIGALHEFRGRNATIVGLPSGLHRVLLRSNDPTAPPIATHDVMLRPGEVTNVELSVADTEVLVDLRIGLEGDWPHVRVTLEVRGIDVSTRVHRVEVVASRSSSIEPLEAVVRLGAPGLYEVSSSELHWAESLTASPGRNGVFRRVGRPVRLTCSVVDASTNAPLDAVVRVYAEDKDGAREWSMQRSREGKFVGVVAAGPRRLFASAEGYIGEQRSFVAEGDEMSESIALVRLGKIETRFGRKTRERPTVVVLLPEEDPEAKVVEDVDANGVAVFADVIPGRYALEWRTAEDGATIVRRVLRVMPGERVTIAE